MSRWYDDPRIVRVIDEGELLHVAVVTRSGPRVTPTAFDLDGRKAWFVVARGSLKARAIAARPRIGALIKHGEKSVMLGGTARLVDPLTARGILSVDRLFDLPFAAAGYLGRNPRHAAGVVRDRPAPTLPLSRVAVELTVERGALLDRHALVAEWGKWSRTRLLMHDALPDACAHDLPEEVPADLANLIRAPGGEVVLGWESLSGPLALPGRISPMGAVDTTSAAAMELAGALATCNACITADRGGPRLKSKRGVVVSGTGTAVLSDDEALAVVDWRRTMWWRGDDVRSRART